MSYQFVLHDLAQKDYEIAVDWYARKSLKAVNNLIFEVENTIQLICDNPKRWRNEYKHFRELGIKKYPYVIIYVFEEEKELVLVTGIFHTSKNPKKKYPKL